ncbi:hypothetical protein NE237_031641 [Protea cynaroides]|uniref:Uncharacterized protein n=1 Tax=Protea cynaroides TaxID=273540 RepID=A0A9Q0R2M9_9MAGN|nr:hypothetical protein NE237_031641 [Protea cynaroides]
MRGVIFDSRSISFARGFSISFEARGVWWGCLIVYLQLQLGGPLTAKGNPNNDYETVMRSCCHGMTLEEVVSISNQQVGSVSVSPGQFFYDPGTTRALIAELERLVEINADRQVKRYPYHINDPEFATALELPPKDLDRVVEIVQQKRPPDCHPCGEVSIDLEEDTVTLRRLYYYVEAVASSKKKNFRFRETQLNFDIHHFVQCCN